MRTRVILLLCLGLGVAAAAPGLAHVVQYDFPLDTDPGWTATGGWTYGAGSTPSGACITGGHTGTNIYGFAASGVTCGYGSNLTGDTLTTSALDCTGLTRTTLSFWRSLSLADDAVDHVYSSDHASLEVSNDGITWHQLWTTVSGAPDSIDGGWTYHEYDLSRYADRQPAVYVRWTMGPTDGALSSRGLNIDDVQVSGDPLEVLAWIPYTSPDAAEYVHLREILQTLPSVRISESTTLDPATLGQDLRGKHVMLVPAQLSASYYDLSAAGAAFADALDHFVRGGGTLVVCGEGSDPTHSLSNYGFLLATGLLKATPAGADWTGGAGLPVLDPSHPLATYLSGSVIASQDSTVSYQVGPETEVVVADEAGDAVVATRMLGAGAVVLLGFDYNTYGYDTAQLLLEAASYPATSRAVLLYDTGESTAHVGLDAIGRLRLPYYDVAGADDFDPQLMPDTWAAVVVDAPASPPAAGWGGLVNYVDGFRPVLLSTAQLSSTDASRDALCAKFGATSNEALAALPALYDWVPASGIFTYRDDVPSPITTWWDNFTWDADRLSALPDASLLAGFTEGYSGTDGAIVVGSYGTTLLDGFLWGDGNQDADGDGVPDVEELVTNQLALLLSVPEAAFSVDTMAITAGQTVSFANDSTGLNTCCYQWYPDKSGCPVFDGVAKACDDWVTGADQAFAYTAAGFYWPVLHAQNGSGYRRVTADTPIAVGFPDAGPTLNSFRPIIACVEAGVVKGFPDGTYKPTQEVKRDAMAVYVARALAGGKEYVPTGPATPSFSDVISASWAYDAIEYCYASGVVKGFSDGTYGPELLVNRGQMAAYMARAISDPAERPDLPGYTPPASPDFPDVASDYSYYKYIEYLYQQGIVKGFSDGSYQPTRTVTRGQMAIYVQRAFGYGTYAP